MDTANYISPPLLFKSQRWVEAAATCFRQHDFNKSISGITSYFNLLNSHRVRPWSHHQTSEVSGNDGWLDLQAALHLPAADAPESELEEEDLSNRHAEPSFNLSEVVTKKLRIGMRDIAIESAFKLLRQPVVKMPWEKDR